MEKRIALAEVIPRGHAQRVRDKLVQLQKKG